MDQQAERRPSNAEDPQLANIQATKEQLDGLEAAMALAAQMKAEEISHMTNEEESKGDPVSTRFKQD